MDWLAHNKEWIFSGVGVVLLGVVVRFGSRIANLLSSSRMPREKGHMAVSHSRSDAYAGNSISNAGALAAPAAIGSYITQNVNVQLAPGATGHGGLVQSTGSEYHMAPTPSEIVAEISGAKPYLKDSVGESYRGSRVGWSLQLRRVEKRSLGGSDSTYFVLMKELGGSELVSLHIDIDSYPLLKTAHQNEVFLVEGTIGKASVSGVDLEDVRTIRKVSSGESR